MTAAAVKVTGEPLHDVTFAGVMLTDGVTSGDTATVTTLLVTFETVVQAALLVITTVTWFPFVRVLMVNVADVCPATDDPLIFH